MKTRKFIAFKVLSFITGGLFLISAAMFGLSYLEYFASFGEFLIVLMPLLLAAGFITLGFMKVKQTNHNPIKILTFILSFALAIIFLIVVQIILAELIYVVQDTIIQLQSYYYQYYYGYVDISYLQTIETYAQIVRVINIVATVLALITPFTLLGKTEWSGTQTQTVYAANQTTTIQPYAQAQPAQITISETYIKQKETKAKELLISGALTQEEYDLYVKKEIEPLKTKLRQSDPLTSKIEKLKELKKNGVIDEEEYKLMLKSLF